MDCVGPARPSKGLDGATPESHPKISGDPPAWISILFSLSGGEEGKNAADFAV